MDEIQVACYKILAALYQLGTDLTLDKNRKFIKVALDRNRPAIGSCLGAFAATFPVAFLEPMMNKQNPFSIHNRIADQSLEAQGKITLELTSTKGKFHSGDVNLIGIFSGLF